mmetsp:Transcript_42519/g.120283  ORF Transcript_42519/g.120283 Transcript_42519/m.120283 type:complete len:638 (+) Transcript_42519:96-2009(+)
MPARLCTARALAPSHAGNGELADPGFQRLVLLLLQLQGLVGLRDLTPDPIELLLVQRARVEVHGGLCSEEAGLVGGVGVVLQLVHCLFVHQRQALHLDRGAVLLFHQPRVGCHHPLEGLLVVRLLLLAFTEDPFQPHRETAPLVPDVFQRLAVPLDLLRGAVAGTLGGVGLLHLHLVELALDVQEVVLQVLALLVLVLELAPELLLLVVQGLHVLAQPLQLLRVGVVRMVALLDGRGRGGQLCQPHLEQAALLVQLLDLALHPPGRAAGLELPARALKPLDLLPHALQLHLHRVVLRVRLAELVLQAIDGHGRRCRDGTVVLELGLDALDHLCEAANGLPELCLQLLLLVVRVPQNLLGHLFLLHRAVELLREPLQQDACVEPRIGAGGGGAGGQRGRRLHREQCLEDALGRVVLLRVEATYRQRDEVARCPREGDEMEGAGLAHHELELGGVERVDDHLGVVGGILRGDVLARPLRAPLHGHDPHGVGGHVDHQVLPLGRVVARHLRLHDVELATPEAQRVVEAPPRGGVQLEGPYLAVDDAIEAVVDVRRLGLHADVGADVVGRDLVHVRGHARDLHREVAHAPLPLALQGHRQAAGQLIRGRDEHAGLEEAAALEPEGEVVVALPAHAAEEVVL